MCSSFKIPIELSVLRLNETWYSLSKILGRFYFDLNWNWCPLPVDAISSGRDGRDWFRKFLQIRKEKRQLISQAGPTIYGLYYYRSVAPIFRSNELFFRFFLREKRKHGKTDPLFFRFLVFSSKNKKQDSMIGPYWRLVQPYTDYYINTGQLSFWSIPGLGAE